MAKKSPQNNSLPDLADGPKEETIGGYWRKVLTRKPSLLDTRSNEELLNRWLSDHPGVEEVPLNVKQGLSNIKSVLRKERRFQRDIPPEEILPMQAAEPVRRAPRLRNLDTLEEQIDDCLTMAKNLDREGLEDVIRLLRKARNEVVWKMGQPE